MSIGHELAVRAGLDPAWDAVLAAWLAGSCAFPHPFVNRARPPDSQHDGSPHDNGPRPA